MNSKLFNETHVLTHAPVHSHTYTCTALTRTCTPPGSLHVVTSTAHVCTPVHLHAEDQRTLRGTGDS